MAATMIGDRKKALEINQKIWQKGEPLSDFFQLIYLDNLINLAEVEQLKMVLEPRLNCIGDNLEHFYNIFARYALLCGDLALLVRISEYENLTIKENALLNFANQNAFKFSVIDYRNVISIILKNISSDLCGFDYGISSNGNIDIIFFTPFEKIRNAPYRKKINEEIADYFEKEKRPALQGISYKIENIATHKAWIK